MGSKGTSTQSGTSTYTPTPQIAAAGNQALGMAQSAASSPFQLPVAPVAGFTPQQQQAFQQTSQEQGMAQPYFDQAQGLFNQSAAPITGAQVNNYMNPYAGYVMSNLAEQQGQQMNQLTGQATQSAGGVGADRIGVAQGELARQQNLASGQTLSGIYGSALSAAQQNAQMQQSAAYGIGNLGGAAQNAAMQGTQQLYGMGSQQQQLNQAQLNAPYQNQLAQIAFPYQNAQYLAGVTGSLAGPLGGTTNSAQTATPAQPSIFSQIAGLGTGLAGAYGAGAFNSLGFGGGSPTYGGGNAFTGDANGGSSANPLSGLSASDYGTGFAPGGAVDGSGGEPSWMTADPTIPTMALQPSKINQPQVHFSSPSTSTNNIGSDLGNVAKAAAQIAPLFLADGGAAQASSPYRVYTENQNTFDERFPKDPSPQSWSPYPVTGDAMQRYAKRQGYADGGETIDYIPQDFNSRFSDAATMGQIERPRFADSDTFRGVHIPFAPGSDPAATTNPSGPDLPGTGLPGDTPYRQPSVKADGSPIVPPDSMNANGTSSAAVPEADNTPPNSSPSSKPGSGMAALSPAAAQAAADNMSSMQGAHVNLPYGDLDHSSDTSRDFAKSPWLALMNAGFGMMAGTSPFAGVNIGKGLQQGVQTLEKQRTESREEETVNQRAKQLALEADKHLRQYTQLTPAGAATIENQVAARKLASDKMEQDKWQLVYDPQSGKSWWSKQGETPVPALPGSGPPGAPNAGPAPATATTPTAAGNQPAQTPTDFSYHPPSTDPATGPGPIFNPKTGALSPEQVQITRKDMDDARNRGNAAADAAMQIGQLKQALAKIDELQASSHGMLQTGAYAQQRFALAKIINGILAPLGLQPVDPALIGSAEEAGKLTTRLGFALSRTLGSREAQQVVKQSIEANPGIENTPEGRKYILATMDSAISRDRDNAQFIGDYRKQWRTTAGAEAEFNKLNPPEKYIAQASVASAPEEFKNPVALQNAVKHLREHPDANTVALFNKIYHGSANYFLKGAAQ